MPQISAAGAGRAGSPLRPGMDLDRRQPLHGRSLDDPAVGCEAAAVAGAVPGLFGGVPLDDAAGVCTDRRHRVHRAVRSAIDDASITSCTWLIP